MPLTLVSGGSGYVGRFIVEGLISAGHEVVVTGRRPPSENFFSAPVRFVEMSLEPDGIDPGIFDRADFFVHAAFDHLPGTYRGGEGDDPESFVRRNLHGSAALFRAAKAVGVKRAVFLSSRAVYGVQSPGSVLTEETEPNPETLYGTVKLDAEKMLFALEDDFFCPLALRITGVYGPTGKGRDHKWAELFRDYIGGRDIAARAGTEVHGEDVAQAVRLVLEVPVERVSGKVFNVSDIVVDRRDLLAIVQKVTGSRNDLCSPADVSGLNMMDTARLRDLGWMPGGFALLEQTVRPMANALKE